MRGFLLGFVAGVLAVPLAAVIVRGWVLRIHSNATPLAWRAHLHLWLWMLRPRGRLRTSRIRLRLRKRISWRA